MENKIKKLTSHGLIFNIILAIFAFAFLLHLSIPTVSANCYSQGSNGAYDRIYDVNSEEDCDSGGWTWITQAAFGGLGGLISDTKGQPTKTNTPAGSDDGSGIFGWLTSGPKNVQQGFLKGAVWAGAAFFIVPFVADLFGLEEGLSNALRNSISAGTFAFSAFKGLGESGKIGGFFGTTKGALVTGLGVGVLVFVLTYKKEEQKVIEFSCNPWEAQYGGERCEECNDAIGGCTEYRCKSLGQACDLVNVGTEDELCVWINPRDVNSALITPWEDVLTKDYTYTRTQPRPPNWGTEIVPENDNNGCIAAFTPIEFGINTDKPTQCKIDFIVTETYEEMQYFFGESSLFSYNHSQRMNLPSPQAIVDFANSLDEEVTGGLEIENDGNYNLYVRCISANGYWNPDPYVIRFCVDDGPDATPPVIVETSIRDGQPVQTGVDEVPIEVYTNEVANCRWSRLDQSFNDMPNTMQCGDSIADVNEDLLYTCSGTLTGVQDRQDNEFYFRCEDQPYKPADERNRNTVSKKLTLVGTEALNIKLNSVRPLDGSTVSGATTTVPVDIEVETENGASNGEATCFYSINNEDNYIKFFETNSFEHKQTQHLTAGEYTYYLRCVDAGGNAAETSTTFNVFVDTQPPIPVRVLYNSNSLQIITDEDATCRYTNDENVQCNFDLDEVDGSPMQHPSTDRLNEHFTSWNTENTYYIKCKDENNVQPAPTQCSIIVKPVESVE